LILVLLLILFIPNKEVCSIKEGMSENEIVIDCSVFY